MQQHHDGLIRHVKSVATAHAPLLALAVVALLTHVSLDAQTGDYDWFAAQLNDQSLLAFTQFRYEVWTSRNIVEALLVILTRHSLLWHIADLAMCVLLYQSLETIFNQEHSRHLSWAICLLILCYPLWDQFTAGWLVTTMNYLWPLIALFFVISCSVRQAREGRLGRPELVCMLIAATYAANVELLSVAVIVVGVVALWFAFHKKQSRWQAVALILIGVVELVNVFVCPGNTNRTILETATWLPEFDSFGLLDKVYLGFVSTMQHYMFEWSPSFMVLCVLAAYLTWDSSRHLNEADGGADHCFRQQRARRILLCIVSSLPLAITICCQCFRTTILRLFPHLGRMFVFLDLQAGERGWAPFVLYVCLILCMLGTLAWLSRDSFVNLFVDVAVIGYGFATRVVMGFSPTLFASSTRTFTFLDFSIIVLVLLLLRQHKEEFSDTRSAYLIGALTALAATTVQSVFVVLGS